MQTAFSYFRRRFLICVSPIFYGFLIASLIISCTQRYPADPVDRLVRELRGSTDFGDGIHTPIRLPATAKPEQVAAKVLTLALNETITNITVLEVKPVIISYGYKPGDIPPPGSEYTAILVDMKPLQKIVLIKYQRDEFAWWNEIYNAK